MSFNYSTIRATGTLLITAAANAQLWTVNINNPAASARLKIYDGDDATGTLVADLDASSKSSHGYGFRMRNGIFVDLTGGNADCSVGWR